MGCDVVESQRFRVANQLAEYAVTAWQWPDAGALIVIDADEQEARELLLLVVQNADRCVAGPGQLASGPQHLVEHRFEVQLRYQAPANIEEPSQVRLLESRFQRRRGPCRLPCPACRSHHTVFRNPPPAAGLRKCTEGSDGPPRWQRGAELGGTVRDGRAPGGALPRSSHTLASMTSPEQRSPVLIGFDGYDDAMTAIRGAGALLAPRPALVAYVWESLGTLLLHTDTQLLTGTMGEAAAEFDAGETARAKEVSEQGAQLASEAGFDAQPVSMRGKPKAWPALLELADKHDVAAIVVGSEGLGAVKSALLGSVSAGLVHHTKRPVLIVPRGAEAPGDGPVILAYDGSEPARRGIVAAAGLIPGHEAISTMVWTSYETVTAMGDIGMPGAVAVAGAQRIDEELAVKALRTAEEGAAVARGAGMSASAEAVREHGKTSGTLIDSAAKHSAAAIVIGSHGRSTISASVLGSVAMGLVHKCPVPLLVVPDR